MKRMKKVLAVVLSLALTASLFAACGDEKKPATSTNTPAPTQGTEATKAPDATKAPEPTQAPDATATPTPEPTPTEAPSVVEFEGNFIYRDSVVTLATNWNPHTYQTADDGYPLNDVDTISGLYSLVFNDANHPIEGKEPFTGYVIVPEMASGEPIDVTAKVKAEHPEFGIPESATDGYAWAVPLRTDLCFDDGTKITPETFVESFKRLQDPKLLNYRAADYYEGTYAIANAKKYYYQGTVGYDKIEMTASEWVAAGNSIDDLFIDAYDFWNSDASYTDAQGNALPQYVRVTDETVYGENVNDAFSGKSLWDEYLGVGAPYESYGASELAVEHAYEADFSFDKVGLFKSGDNEITYVFTNSLHGFYLKTYALSTSWLIEPTLYDKCLTETTTASGTVWSSTYNTSVETSRSYGPYKMDGYQLDKSMHFVKNDKWFGWTDGNHVYVDPEDGETYPMYQTTEIDTQVVAEAATRKNMFFAGQLMGYGLQAEDFDQYRNSEYAHSTPAETIYFAILNGYEKVINEREAAADFDQATMDLQSMTLNTFRRAVAVTFDRDLFCATVSPARVPGYGIIGNTYIYDPETCAYYRDTPQAMQALCDFYSVDTTKYATLKDAVNSITGYDPVKAKELYQEAYKEALEKKFITDADNDGKSDQVVTITYSISSASDFQTKMINYLNEKIAETTVGTGFEGKIKIVESAPCGNDWSNNIRNGIYDMVLGGWSGSAMDPFGLSDLYTNPSRAYDGQWFDATKVNMTLAINGKDLTMSLKKWSDALNGTMVTVDGVDYNFGYEIADVETRLNILSKLETIILGTYDYIPMMNNGSMALLSQQVYYVVEEYNPVLSRGGIRYMKYNYDETEWKDYVASQGGQLQY